MRDLAGMFGGELGLAARMVAVQVDVPALKNKTDFSPTQLDQVGVVECGRAVSSHGRDVVWLAAAHSADNCEDAPLDGGEQGRS